MKIYTARNYVDYLKNNLEHYWFKRRLYGWGWFPATREGWLVLLVWFAVVLSFSMWFGVKFETQEPRLVDMVMFFAVMIASVAVLIRICYVKGEKPKWTWGRIEVK